MKTASIEAIKQEMQQLPSRKLIELCLRLARSKKETKELLGFLLFDAQDEHSYTESIKLEMNELFTSLPKATAYLTKKSLRQVLRMIGKHSKFMASKAMTADLLIHFCTLTKEKGFDKSSYTALEKIFFQQVKKLEALIPSIEEDLQYDYRKQLDSLTS
ncbi:MAG: hypothetical protein ABI687_13570 [Flavitalea sp.]